MRPHRQGGQNGGHCPHFLRPLPWEPPGTPLADVRLASWSLWLPLRVSLRGHRLHTLLTCSHHGVGTRNLSGHGVHRTGWEMAVSQGSCHSWDWAGCEVAGLTGAQGTSRPPHLGGLTITGWPRGSLLAGRSSDHLPPMAQHPLSGQLPAPNCPRVAWRLPCPVWGTQHAQCWPGSQSWFCFSSEVTQERFPSRLGGLTDKARPFPFGHVAGFSARSRAPSSAGCSPGRPSRWGC